MRWETVDLASEINWKHFIEFEDENRYYVRVVQRDGNMAWSSPVWVTKK